MYTRKASGQEHSRSTDAAVRIAPEGFDAWIVLGSVHGPMVLCWAEGLLQVETRMRACFGGVGAWAS